MQMSLRPLRYCLLYRQDRQVERKVRKEGSHVLLTTFIDKDLLYYSLRGLGALCDIILQGVMQMFCVLCDTAFLYRQVERKVRKGLNVPLKFTPWYGPAATG